MPLQQFKTSCYLVLLLLSCFGWKADTSLAAPISSYDDNLVTYPDTPSEVLPIEPLLIYPESRDMYYQARTLDGAGERDIIFVKLLPGKLDGYRPKQQRLLQKAAAQRRRELGLKDIFYVKAHANGQFSHERLKVYRLPEFYAISVFRNGEK